MPKQFYTEKDIEDLFGSGKKALAVTDDVVLTELAYEKARRLGLQLVSDDADNPPAAPVRPYLSNGGSTAPTKPTVEPVARVSQAAQAKPRVLPVEERIRAAVVAKLGTQVDAKLLDNIIHRVVQGLGLQ